MLVPLIPLVTSSRLILTWNTVRQDWGNVSKWLLESLASVNLPPKICMPNREKMKMNKNRMTNKELMEDMELTKDLTKLPMEAQYLKRNSFCFSLAAQLRSNTGNYTGENRTTFAFGVIKSKQSVCVYMCVCSIWYLIGCWSTLRSLHSLLFSLYYPFHAMKQKRGNMLVVTDDYSYFGFATFQAVIAEILCINVLSGEHFFEVSRSNKHLSFIFKYFIHTEYRLVLY